MGVFGDVFEGDQGAKAANATRGYLNLMKSQVMPVIGAGYGNSMGYVAGGANEARNALNQGYTTGTAAIGTGYADAQGYLSGGATDAMGRLEAAKGAYNPVSALAGKFGAGTDLYLDALGARGAEGNTRATEAFTPSLAYNFNLTEGLDAINRRRAAGGMLASGNADRDAQEYGAGLASREQSAWMDRLAGLVNPELTATSGAAAGLAGLGRDQASLANSSGTAQAGLATQRGQMLADLAKTYGQNAANVGMTEGKSLADLTQAQVAQIMGLNLNIAPQFTKSYTDEAAARTAGSANLVNAGMQGLNMLAGSSFLGGGGGMGGLAGNGNLMPSASFLANGPSWG